MRDLDLHCGISTCARLLWFRPTNSTTRVHSLERSDEEDCSPGSAMAESKSPEETGCGVFAVSDLLIILLITTIPSIFSLHAVDDFSKSEMIIVHSSKSFVRSSSL